MSEPNIVGLGVLTIMMSPIFCGIVFVIKQLIFPSKTESEKKLEQEIEKRVRKEKEEARRKEKARRKEVQNSGRLCPYMTSMTNFGYGPSFHNVFCYNGDVYFGNNLSKMGTCAIASECAGAYHPVKIHDSPRIAKSDVPA